MEAQQKLEYHQHIMESAPITKDLLEREVDLHQTMHSTCRKEEQFMRQNSKSLWLQDGD